MTVNKTFIAVSSEIVNHKLVYLNTSVGLSMSNENGIPTRGAINFLYELIHKYNNPGTKFICYSARPEHEYFFRDLPDNLKDTLFQASNVKKEVEEMKQIKSDVSKQFYDLTEEMTEENAIMLYNQILDINRAIGLTQSINFNKYKITLISGKFLTISQNKKTFTLYDIFGYFRKPLSVMIKTFFDEENEFLTEKKSDDLEIRKLQNTVDCFYIVKLMTYVNERLNKYGIHLNRFHGASTITSAIFARCKAKDNFRKFDNERFVSKRLNHAIMSSLYGARTEQFKLGTFKNINVYDLNSAYCEAAIYLPKILRHPIFTKRYRSDIFSLWFIEYDLPKNMKYGILPHRDATQTARYKRRGSGWYYQPEIKFLIDNYPCCFKIKHGFYVPYETPSFVPEILDLYELRRTLKEKKDPLEKIIKLGLTTIYGKFLQQVGKAYYYNPLYGGFITSFVRAKLLDATKGKEKNTICFLTDAIHSTVKLDLPMGDGLGQFRYKKYNTGLYLGAGVYELKNDTETKRATRGFTEIDFNEALKQLAENGTYSAKQDFFVGHNLNKLTPVTTGKYLQTIRKTIKIAPLNSNVRTYNKIATDFSKTEIESDLIDSYSGLESAVYQRNDWNSADIIFEGVEAGKYI